MSPVQNILDMAEMPGIEELEGRVRRELDREAGSVPDWAIFHSMGHTFRVYERAKYLADEEGLTDEEKYLVSSAALLHDIEYTRDVIGGNTVEKVTSEFLPDQHYSASDIETIEGIISSTEFNLQGKELHVNPPEDRLQEIVCDADFDFLGRRDFYFKLDDLRRELYLMDDELGRREFYSSILEMMEMHDYFTDKQLEERRDQKHRNMEDIREGLEESNLSFTEEIRTNALRAKIEDFLGETGFKEDKE